MNQRERSKAAAALGRRGGLKGGRARAAALGKAERSAIARQGAAAANGGIKIKLSLATRLASLVVHADEYTDPDTAQSAVDEFEIRRLVEDPEVQEWIKSLGALAPVKR